MKETDALVVRLSVYIAHLEQQVLELRKRIEELEGAKAE